MIDFYSVDDIKSINELGKVVNSNFDNLFHINRINDNENILVYKMDNMVVGFIHYSVNYEVCDILNIVVLDNYRNKGIGCALLNKMISYLDRNSIIMLEVRCDNDSAIGFYLKNNFIKINTRVNYYDGIDAIVMKREVL